MAVWGGSKSLNIAPIKIKDKQFNFIVGYAVDPLWNEANTAPDITADRFDLIYTRREAIVHWWRTMGANANGIMEENQFLGHMRKLTNSRDHDLLDIFDLFDKEDSGSIGFEEFLLIFSLLISRESGRATQFLFMQGKKLFEVISRGSPRISFEVFSRIGLMCGLPEQAILYRLKDHNVSVFDQFDYDEFMTHAFVIFDELDKGSFEAKKAPPTHRGDGQSNAAADAMPTKEGKEKDKDKEKDLKDKDKEDACVIS